MALVNKKASVAKLVDATDSKSVPSDRVLVQVRPEVPNLTTTISKVVFSLSYKALIEFDKSSFLKAHFS